MKRSNYNRNWYYKVGKARRLAKLALTKVSCRFCKIIFPMRRPKQVFCSKRCYGSFLSVTCSSDSYPVTYKPNHPNSQKDGAIKKHRLVMAEKLGRPLTSKEIVHHINGNKKDFSPENLEVMTRAEHIRHHHLESEFCKVSGCGLEHHAKGLCATHYTRLRKNIVPSKFRPLRIKRNCV